MLLIAFELGLWNAWIFMIYVLLSNFLPFILAGKVIDKEVLKKLGADRPLSDNEKKLLNIYSLLFFAIVAYSIFLPLELGTVWFYAGFIIYLLGVIVETMAIMNFLTTPVDKPANKGIYRFSRNPMYFGMFLIFLGTSIACVSLIFLLLTVIFIILSHVVVVYEERFCIQKYRDSYQEYLNRIPRWIGIPKSSKMED
ncbi:MAG: isoprenylcysteine carboxylmethyltransferase family protein [Candidatus Bathyarchaeota archaeon]|jgi:protein-S-isoprenylcysteine O-methyltransferase Ste14